MCKLSSFVVPCLGSVVLLAGCAGPEEKLGRGVSNLLEPIRGGEMRRSVEESSVLEGPSMGFTTGALHGMDRTLARTAAGFYEVVTFPIPNHAPKNYDPIFLTEEISLRPGDPVYPDSYRPNWLADQLLSPDTSLGFGGGDVAPMVPGSRFHIFDQ